MSNISLNGAERKALLALKQTTGLQERTQNRLATGLKIEGAIDGAEAYYKSKSLSDRSADFVERMSDIDQAISLILATQEALSSVTTVLKQMKGVVLAATDSDGADTTQFDEMINQINLLIGDASYQGTFNWLTRPPSVKRSKRPPTQLISVRKRTAKLSSMATTWVPATIYLTDHRSCCRTRRAIA
ncbi:flagellin [Magnetovibrio blakemorei]|uniref:Flagellin N-terminal domain-containing protein n=1 Tax=Magnetovibrio blakemorei TaxID=28181 RepID=A0A1E5QB69_9PROT|nr:hypothetical protein [Magnetovibrio blakemorei]OEJ69217.1 hypothetical protein BEN30_03780 [Magnetovibrio blakemorei]